jgi:hypothetical protein
VGRLEPRVPAECLIRSIVDIHCLADAPMAPVDVDPAGVRMKR